MNREKIFFSILFLFVFISFHNALAQQEEPILYYQMEPLDDSLFIHIQQQVFIDPPDPKAEIIVDLRDPNNQTVSIKGTLYPFLAFKPETRAKIQTYPFKINLEENITYTSVFTRIINRLNLGKIIAPPTYYQISPTLGYINPFFQMFGGERFGLPIKNDLGISFGLGTPYSGPLETNFLEARLHLLGFYAGGFTHNDAFTNIKSDNNLNNLYATWGYEIGYVIPLGNFFEVSYLESSDKPSDIVIAQYMKNDTVSNKVNFIQGSYFNWELRYPFSFLGSTRGKVYFAKYLNELHIGYTGRELSMAGSTFDFRFDAMFNSKIRNNQYVFDVLIQKIAESWGFSAFAMGPAVILSKTDKGSFGITSIFINIRLKVGTSL
ncbi:MAG: hypothetical protein P8Z35_00940 [Ignavibacteriaceae bacterium]